MEMHDELETACGSLFEKQLFVIRMRIPKIKDELEEIGFSKGEERKSSLLLVERSRIERYLEVCWFA